MISSKQKASNSNVLQSIMKWPKNGIHRKVFFEDYSSLIFSFMPHLFCHIGEHCFNEHRYSEHSAIYENHPLASDHYNTIYSFVHHNEWPLHRSLCVNPLMFTEVVLYCKHLTFRKTLMTFLRPVQFFVALAHCSLQVHFTCALAFSNCALTVLASSFCLLRADSLSARTFLTLSNCCSESAIWDLRLLSSLSLACTCNSSLWFSWLSAATECFSNS